MKAGLLTIAALAATASAQIRHGRRHGHQHKARDYYVTETEVVTATAPNAIVYVDANGNPIYTSYPGQAAQSPPPPPYNPPAVTTTSVAPAPAAYTSPAPAPAAYSSPAPVAPAADKPKPAPKPAAPAGSASGYGIAYAPYTSDGQCKTQDQVNSDFEKFSGYSMVRFYGCDCNQASTVINAAKAKNMKVFAGIFNIAQVESEVQTLISAASGNWDIVDTVSIGNELVNNGAAVSDVVNAVNIARGLLKAAGYTGSVVTVDTFNAIIANPELCQCSDYAAANCHAFFDSATSAADAGKFVHDQYQRVQSACGGKKTVITESGWPWNGQANGAAIPSKENQAAAISSLKSAFSSNIFLFSAFDDAWKKNSAATYGAEQFWGLY